MNKIRSKLSNNTIVPFFDKNHYFQRLRALPRPPARFA
ncbi:hypothetical protein predicted by Glimmer/Critica [Salmonella enterica subsp. enterica serovar Weltevreden str. 2007-60-3289-1]|nr:hypothetical protein predicted by Glimmer/Critica [Salmonella enterica subsp. enterica serovar Weltevreden str. 2007-60-3289-1]